MEPYVCKKQRLNPSGAHDRHVSQYAAHDDSSSNNARNRLGAQSSNSEIKIEARVLGAPPRKPHPSQTPVQRFDVGYGYNLLELQVDGLLMKLQKDYERKAAEIDNALRKLMSIIEHIPEREAASVLDAERRLQETSPIQIPFPQPRPNKHTRYLFAYAKPADIKVVGSYARKTAIRTEDGLTVDLAITMPTSIFQNKDHLNYRYFHKRAYYLACLASGIAAAEDFNAALSYSFQSGNPLQPIILVRPDSDGQDNVVGAGFQIRIILAASDILFPITKTLPARNCIRMHTPEASAVDTASSATPFYNASLRSECCTSSFLKFLYATSTRVDTFGDACRLGSVWLRQRRFGTSLGSGGFGEFEWASLVALLLHGGGGLDDKPVLSKGYSSLQLFKATLQYLAAKDLVKNRVLIWATGSECGNGTGPVLYDGQRGLNVLFKMTDWSYRTLRHEAQVTLQALSSPLVDRFESAFISKVDVTLQRFDSVIRLPLPPKWKPPTSADAIDRTLAFSQSVCQLLDKGLNDRISLIHPWFVNQSPWSLESAANTTEKHGVVSFGLLLNPDRAFRIVDQGPSTKEKAEAAAFRLFWGEKAELRRFKDGSILETLVWAQAPEKSVVAQISRYLVQRHLQSEAIDDFKVVENFLNGYISDPGPPALSPLVLNAFGTLEKEIRAIKGLPLQIRHVSAACAELRYASLIGSPDVPLMQQRKNQAPADVCVQFEGSARWPNDLAAVQRTKIAFLLKMGELLESDREGLIAQVGLENQEQRLLNSSFLDVIYPSGAAFRVRIHHEHELDMLGSALREKTLRMERREDVAFAVAAHKRTFIQAPAITQAIRTLCTRFPLLSPSMRLLKRWRDSHLLSGHITDELIELLTVRIFVTPYPYQAPGSLTTAFFRTLAYISNWDWHSEPLIVDLSGTMNGETIDAIKLRFEGCRKIDPAMNRIVLFAASNLDPEGVTWTGNPSKVVATHFTGLARAAHDLAKEQDLDIQAGLLFTRSTAEYDFVIHLNVTFAKGNQGLTGRKSAFKNLQLEEDGDARFVGYDPVHLYLEELRSLYGSNVLFFHERGGSVIGGLWNPQTGPRPWKTNISYSRIPLVQDGQESVNLNKSATLNDIARLGADMIAKIEIN